MSSCIRMRVKVLYRIDISLSIRLSFYQRQDSKTWEILLRPVDLVPHSIRSPTSFLFIISSPLYPSMEVGVSRLLTVFFCSFCSFSSQISYYGSLSRGPLFDDVFLFSSFVSPEEFCSSFQIHSSLVKKGDYFSCIYNYTRTYNFIRNKFYRLIYYYLL